MFSPNLCLCHLILDHRTAWKIYCQFSEGFSVVSIIWYIALYLGIDYVSSIFDFVIGLKHDLFL